MYNYFLAVKSDVVRYIMENYAPTEIVTALEDADDFTQTLIDECWDNDYVTGNASGSYTYNRALALEYLHGNMETLADALEDFCVGDAEIGRRFLTQDWEWFDVTIRCYILSAAIDKTVEEMKRAAASPEILWDALKKMEVAA